MRSPGIVDVVAAALAVLTLVVGGRLAAADGDAGGVVVDRVLLVVDGVPILASEIARREKEIGQAGPAAGGGPAATPAAVRQWAIASLTDEALMVAAARGLGLAVSPAQVDRALEEVKRQHRLDDAALAAALARVGATVAEYRDDLERQLLLIETQRRMIGPAALVDEAAVRAEWERERAGGGAAAGTFEDARERLHARLYEAELVKVMERWLAEQRKAALIESHERP